MRFCWRCHEYHSDGELQEIPGAHFVDWLGRQQPDPVLKFVCRWCLDQAILLRMVGRLNHWLYLREVRTGLIPFTLGQIVPMKAPYGSVFYLNMK